MHDSSREKYKDFYVSFTCCKCMIELFNFNHAWFNTRLYMYCEISAFIYMQDKMLVYIASITLVFFSERLVVFGYLC